MQDLYFFEHPVNDHMRACLRLEQLFEQAAHHLEDTSLWGSRATTNTLLEILNVIDRPDLKGKLAKALSTQATQLRQLQQFPQVDLNKLESTLSHLERLINTLHHNQDQLGRQLREHPMLHNVRQHNASPGGACAFNAPSYYVWLAQPTLQRQQLLKTWLREFDTLKDIISLLLELARNNRPCEERVAEQGFYQQNLDPAIDYQLIRVGVPTSLNVFPEISVGRHRLAIHFTQIEINKNDTTPQQTKTLTFQLANSGIGSYSLQSESA